MTSVDTHGYTPVIPHSYEVGDVLTEGWINGDYGQVVVIKTTPAHIYTAFYPAGAITPTRYSEAVYAPDLRIQPIGFREVQA